MNSRGAWWHLAILVVWTFVLLALLTAPIGRIPMPRYGIFFYWDKYAHIVLFFVTSFVSVFGVRFRRYSQRLLFGLLFSLFLACGTEFAQSFISYRYADFYDLLADLLGVFMGLFGYMVCYMNDFLRSRLKL